MSTFAERFSAEFHPHALRTVLFTPNLLLSTAVAKFKLSGKKEDRGEELERQREEISQFVALIHEYSCEESPKILKALYSLEGEGLLMLGMIFYPTLLKQILLKVEADKRPNPQKEYHSGHQRQHWSKILEHQIFDFNEDDEILEHALGLDSDVLNKYFDLYVDRTSECFKDDDILDWMKTVIGYVLNEIDNGNFDRDVMFQFVFSALGLPFELKRYSDLSKEFFNDDFTTINAQDLFGGVPPAMNLGGAIPGGNNQAQLRAQLEQMIANGQVPPQIANMIRNRAGAQEAAGGLPPVDLDNLILEDPNFAHEQELIMQQINQDNQQPVIEEEDFLILDAGDEEVNKENDDEN